MVGVIGIGELRLLAGRGCAAAPMRDCDLGHQIRTIGISTFQSCDIFI